MKKLSLFFVFLAVSVSATAASADPASVHGMLLVGNRTLFASHLPMFHRPHDYQVILEVALPPAAVNLLSQDRARTGEKIYTIEPERFVLPEVVAAKKPFHAKLYHGHFERGGTLLAANVEVAIRKVVYFKKFIEAEPRPAGLEYFVFGSPVEAFLAHRITSAPDFDQLLEVKITGPLASPRVFLTGRPESEPLQAGEELPGIAIRTEIYLERGDLSGG